MTWEIKDYFKKHGIPLLIFLAIAILWTVISFRTVLEELNSDLTNVLLMVVKQTHPETFPTDGLFADKQVFAFYTPWIRYYLGWVYSHTGSLELGLQVLAFPMNLLYLIGAYHLFLYLHHNRLVASLLAVLSGLPMAAPAAAEMSGIGPIRVFGARTFFWTFVPFILLGYFKNLEHRGRLAIIFFLTGVLANIHPVSAYLLVMILLICHLFYFHFAWPAWLTVLGCGVSATLGALPIGFTYSSHIGHSVINNVDPAQLAVLVQKSFPHGFFPPINLAHLPYYLGYIMAGVIAVFGIWTLTRQEKSSNRLLFVVCLAGCSFLLLPNIKYFVYFFLFYLLFFVAETDFDAEFLKVANFTIVTFLLSVLPVAFIQKLCDYFNIPPFGLDTIRAARYAPLAMFMLMGYPLLSLKKLTGARNFRRLGAILLLGLCLFMTFRLAFRSYIRVRPNLERVAEADLGRWAKQHTSPEALFVFPSLTFRLVAERSIVYCWKDRGLGYYAGKKFIECLKHMEELEQADNQPQKLLKLAHKYRADYIVVKKTGALPHPNLPVVYENSHFYLVPVQHPERNITGNKLSPAS